MRPVTAHMVAPAYDRVMWLARSAGDEIPRPRLRVVVPAHCSAGGCAVDDGE